ncbi:hypothetical protein RRG08_016957 [Elysia crispata]|uniref:Uncharacterized protein n=1 Tax=Elysia crispata TaxID=231223 RepID=A0AAE1A5Z6_9GAST|nr:hypothetical protein RRG08_016957 [Elysia crispata]
MFAGSSTHISRFGCLKIPPPSVRGSVCESRTTDPHAQATAVLTSHGVGLGCHLAARLGEGTRRQCYGFRRRELAKLWSLEPSYNFASQTTSTAVFLCGPTLVPNTFIPS